MGFICTDGIVLCSDRQMTSDGGMKFQAKKLGYMTGMFEGVRMTACSAYAGDPEGAKILRTEMRERLGKEIAGSKFDGLQSLKARKALEKIFNNPSAKYLEMLIGIRFDSGEKCLFRTKGRKVLEATTEYIGIGDSSVLRYLAEVLLPRTFMSVSEANVIGSYVVSVANRFVVGCSGGPDVFTIYDNGNSGDSYRGPYPNARERFFACEDQVGKALRELLYSGATKSIEVINPKPQSESPDLESGL